jgi:hypothetical protein
VGGNVTLKTIVSIGTEDGIEFIDYRFTTSGAATIDISMMGGYTTTASTGETWTTSSYFKLVGGSLTNISQMRIIMSDSSGSSIAVFTPTNAALRTQRVTLTRVLGTTTSVGNLIRITTSGAADFTLRVGLPQLELGNTITSPIKTSGATVTRAADRLTYSLSANAPWFQSPNGYTYSVEFLSASNSQGSGVVYAGTSGGSFSNTSYFTENFTYIINGVGDTGVSLTAQLRPAFTTNKIGASINYAGARYSINGAALTASTFARAGYAAMTDVAVLSAPWGNFNHTIGWARSATLSNYFYSDSELRALTT